MSDKEPTPVKIKVFSAAQALANAQALMERGNSE